MAPLNIPPPGLLGNITVTWGAQIRKSWGQKGKDSASKAEAAALSQSKMSSFFSQETAPLFAKQQERMQAPDGGGGSEGAASGGSAAAGSAAAGSTSTAETPIIVDNADPGAVEGEGVSTADDSDYATESEDEAIPPDSLTDRDACNAEPLAKELEQRFTAFRADEAAAALAGKKRCKIQEEVHSQNYQTLVTGC
eukprot:2156176-Rhodomonas_salina.2